MAPDRKLTESTLVLRIIGLLRDQGKAEKDLTDFLRVSPSVMTRWKYDGSNAYLKYIDEICEFLDTTPNYLFWGPADEEERLTDEEKELIRMYRKFDNGKKKCIKDTMKYFSKK